MYGKKEIFERHRHRYEVNNNLLPELSKKLGYLKVTGLSEDRKLVEIIEMPDHPWFVASQFHPEFTSTPRDGHPLFKGFIKAAIESSKRTNSNNLWSKIYMSVLLEELHERMLFSDNVTYFLNI